MTSLSSLINARYRLGEPLSIPDYYQIEDVIHHKPLAGRLLPKIPSVARMLESWLGLDHPGLFPIYRCLTLDQHYLAILPDLAAATPLSQLKATRMKPEQIRDVFFGLLRAGSFLSDRHLRHPHLDLDHILQHPALGVRLIGHEAATLKAAGKGGLAATIDLRYTAPEELAGSATGTPAEIYNLGALMYHFLNGEPYRADGGYESVSRSNRKLAKAWDDMLCAMLASDPAARPNWNGLWRQSQDLFKSADRGGVHFPVWVGGVDQSAIDQLDNLLVQAKSQPQALCLRVVPGRERIQRLLPFAQRAREMGFAVIHTWRPGPQVRSYQTINEMIEIAAIGFGESPPGESGSQWPVLSEWQTVDELKSQWQPVMQRLESGQDGASVRGLLLIAEDVARIDPPTIELFAALGTWLQRMPFVLVTTCEFPAHPHVLLLQKRWPHPWQMLVPPPLDGDRLDSLLWHNPFQPARQAILEAGLLATGGDETLMIRWLDDQVTPGSRATECLIEQWDHIEARSRVLLKIMSCSEKPLAPEAFRQAFQIGDADPELRALLQSLWIKRVGETPSRYKIAAPVLREFCLSRIPAGDLRLIREKLFQLESTLPQPDPCQLLFLAVALGREDERRAAQDEVIGLVCELGRQGPLRRLAAIARETGNPALRFFPGLAELLDGTATSVGFFKDYPLLEGLAKAQRHRNEGQFAKAAEEFRGLCVRRGVPLAIKGLCLVQWAESAAESEDYLTVARVWRNFTALDFDSLDAEIPVRWMARAAVCLLKTGKDYAKEFEILDLPRFQAAKPWIRANRFWRDGQFRKALAEIEAATVSDEHGDWFWKGQFHKFLGNALYRNYRPERAIQAYQYAESCFAKVGYQPGIDQIRFNLASAENLAGRFTASIVRFQPLFHEAEQRGDLLTQAQILFHSMVCALFQNDESRFQTLFEQLEKCNKRLKSSELRVRAATINSFTALLRSKDEIIENLDLLERVLSESAPDPLVLDEAMVGIRLSRFALGETDFRVPAPRYPHTRWRHQLLDFLCGNPSVEFDTLIQTIGEGYFGACHFFLLRCMIEKKLIPIKYLSKSLVEAFESHARRIDARYESFFNEHFGHIRDLGEVPRDQWLTALGLFEAIRWDEPRADTLEKELLHALGGLWPFLAWGRCVRRAGRWLGEEQAGAKDFTQPIAAHLNLVGLEDVARPVVSTFIEPQTHQSSALLILPLKPGTQQAILWFLSDRADVSAANHLEPLFRFYSKLFEYLGHEQSDRDGSAALRAKDDSAAAHPGGFSRGGESGVFSIVGASGRIREALAKIAKYGPSNLNIHIYGESGTGKELAARAVHAVSARSAKPFRAINCAHFPENLVESELFGYARGAFTGAAVDRAGLLEMVDGGTLFLDEIGDINGKIQSLLLRVVQEGEFSRIGETRVRKVNIRFVTATNKNLHDCIDQGMFRADLFFRLVEEELKLPALRERFEDLPLLAAHFVAKHQPGRNMGFKASFFEHLRTYDWPGNVRELESYFRKLLVHWPDAEVLTHRECLPFLRAGRAASLDEDLSLEAFTDVQRKRFLGDRLARFGGNRTRAAASLGISRQQLANLIRKYRLN